MTLPGVMQHHHVYCFLARLMVLPGLEVIKLEYSLRLKIKPMIGCLRTRVRKQPIIVLYFDSENDLKFYNLEARANVTLPGVMQHYHMYCYLAKIM